MGGCLCMLLSSKGSMGNSQTVSKASIIKALILTNHKCVCERRENHRRKCVTAVSISAAVCKLPAHNARESLSHQMVFVCPI